MNRNAWSAMNAVFFLAMLLFALSAFGDDKMKKAIESGKFDAAIEVGEKIAPESRTVEDWLQLGQAYSNIKTDAKAAEKAQKCFDEAMKSNPSDPLVYVALGQFQVQNKNYPEAIKNFQKSFLLQRTAEAAEGIAIAASKLKDWDKARDAAESAIEIDSNVFDARLILATILFDKKDYTSAAPEFEQIVKKKPGEVEYWRKLATCYLSTGDKEKCALVDPHIAELDPKDIKSRQRLADYAMEKGDEKTALTNNKALALLTPTDPKPFKNLFTLSLKDGDTKDAILYLKNYLVLDSTDASYYKQLGDLLYQTGDMDGALNAYRATLRLNPNAKDLFKNYSEIVLKKNLDDEALKVIGKAIIAKEADESMYSAGGDINKKRKNWVAAIKMYQGALDIDKKNIPALTSLGECQANSSDVRNAIITYQQVVMLNGQATTEYKTLGDLILKSGKESEAIDTYKMYLAKVADDQEVASIIGLYEFNNKQYKNAIDYLGKIKDPKYMTVSVLYALGSSYYQLQDCKQAIDYFEKVKSLKPVEKTLASALHSLAECYEKSGDEARAAEAYNAYTKLPSVKDADASYLKAYLREKSDQETAAKMYDANTKVFPKDYRNFFRLGLINAKTPATLGTAVTNLRAASLLVDTIPQLWQTLGDVYGKLKNEDGELTAYKKLLALQPQNMIANKSVGTILMARKQYPAAISNLEIVLTLDPSDLESQILVADGYSKTNRYKEASEHLKKARELKPDDVTIRLNLIEALDKAGLKDDASSERGSLSELDKKIVASDKKNIDSRQRLVMYSISKKDTKTAYATLNELAQLTPKDPKVFKNLYDISIAEDNKKEAIEYLKKYLALKPDNAGAQKDLADLLYGQRDFEGALNAYRTARKLDPNIKAIYANYVDILINKNLTDEATAVISAAITAKEADARAYAFLGDIYKKQAQFASAAKMYKGALDTDTKNIAVLTSLGECQAKSGDLKNAVTTYEQVVMLNPTATNEIKELGTIQEKLGNMDQAMESYRKYVDRTPTDEALAKRVGTYNYQKKQYPLSLQYMELVKNPQLRNIEFLADIGNAYYQTSNYGKAAEIFSNVSKTKGVAPVLLKEILKPLGDSYEKQNQFQQAVDAYSTYTALPGVTDPEISFKKGVLQEKLDQGAAIKTYASNTVKFPKDSRNFVHLGLLYAQKKETYNEAAATLGEATKLVDTIADVWLQLAQVDGKLNRTDAELAAYKKYLALRPQDFNANRRVGEILLGKKQYSDAITNLEMVLTTEPNSFEVLCLLSDAYESTGRHPKAMELLAKAKDIKGNDPAVRERLYKMYKKDGQKAKAESEIKDLVDMTKDNKYRLWYFKDLVDAQKFNEAADIAQQIRTSDPLNFEGLMAVATIQRLQRKFSEAVESYKSVLYMKEDYAPALLGRADAHFGLGDLDRASTFYQKALQMDPKMAEAEMGLARIAKLQKKNDAYMQHLNKAKALDPAIKE